MSQTYVALDLETTGLDATRDEIIEIGCVRFRDGEILDEWSSLVNPGRRIPEAITLLTGISSQDVITAPSLHEVLPALQRFAGNATLVAHNVSFDLGFLRAAGFSFPGPALDTFELAGVLLPNQSSYSLGALAHHFAIPLDSAHRALDDARATARLFAALESHAAALPLPTLIEINRLASNGNWNLRAFFVEAEKRATRTAFLQSWQRRALEAGELGPLLSEEAARRVRYGPELDPAEQPTPLDVDVLAAFLEPGGPLAAAFPGYEHRAPQVDMLRAVAEAFNNGDHLLIEAGTGTGKSLAYLLPAIAWAVQNRRRVVISTNTINLQDQLEAKDIPDLKQVFASLLAGEDGPQGAREQVPGLASLAHQVQGLRAVIMKGRANYLCPRRFDAMRSRPDLNDDEVRVLARVLVWLAQTSTGDRSEIFLPGGRDQAIWSRLATESGTCTAERCETSQGGRCFFYRNRRQAEAAHIVIVNHALLLSDVAVGSRALPEYRHLIIDEAHHLESATTNQLSFRATQDGLERLLDDLYPEAGQDRSGLLYEVRRRSEKGLPLAVKEPLQREAQVIQRQVEGSREHLVDFFQAVTSFLELRQERPGQYSQRIRLDSRVRSQPAWSQVEIAWENAGVPLFELAESIGQLSSNLAELDASGVAGWDDLLADLSNVGGLLMEAYVQLHAAITHPDQNGIYWAEVAPGSNRISIHSAPLHVGPLVEQHLFYQKENVILTSATLRTADSYDYLQERLHAYEARPVTVGSPFDYEASTLVYVPTDIDEPNSQRFQGQVEAAILALTRALQGRTLALFTSYDQLRRTTSAIGLNLMAAGITVYQQGSGGSRQQLLEDFRTAERAVLMGTRSFWEGIDVVGPALSGLVITRLPFAVPNDPIVAARAETFDNPFYQYSVPDAILRFRQGFGRLIRSRQDRGVCVILDKRVLTKQYGRLFLESLPDCTVRRGSLAQLAQAAVVWLQE